jgi:DNA-binding NarL/FixJ family response regulator
MQQTTVLIADDHPLLRQGLKVVIEQDKSFLVTAEASDGPGVLALIRKLKPELAVLDINMPGKDGLGVAREVQAEQLPTKIIFVTVHSGEDLLREALRTGVRGYILKDTSLFEILNGLRAVRDGHNFVSPVLQDVVQKTRSNIEASLPPGRSALTPSERKILNLIAAGKSSKEIASELFIHYKTVENHRTNISQKLGVSGPHALLRFALQYRSDF